MPDLFIAPEENLIRDLHHRMPADNSISDSHNKKVETPPADKARNESASSPFITKAVQQEKLDQDTRSNIIPLFASFWQHPTGVYFDTQEIDEHILLFLRRHPITNLGWIISNILFALLPPIAFYGASLLDKQLIFQTTQFTIAIVFFYYLIVLANAFSSFLSWYYNISLITEKRVVDIELSNLIGKKIAATKITLVQDVNYEQNGTLRSIFDYGDVLIQTAGTIDNFLVHAVPRPEAVVRIVEDLIGEEQKGQKHV